MNGVIEATIRHPYRAAAAAIALVFAVALLWAAGDGPAAPAAASSTPAWTSATTSRPTTGTTTPTLPTGEAPIPTLPAVAPSLAPEVSGSATQSGVVVVASAFVQTWLAGRDVSHAAWMDSLSGTARDSLIDGLAVTDPAQIPDADLDDVPVLIAVEGLTATVAATLTDGTSLQLTLTRGPDGWKATDIVPAGD